jgi:hypothetical protein
MQGKLSNAGAAQLFLYGGFPMNSYSPLYEYLRAFGQEKVNISFSELETLLGFTLPKSAYSYSAWWANGGHSQANAWLHAGYKVDNVDIPGKVVMLRRIDVLPVFKVQDKKMRPAPIVKTETMPVDPKSKTILACGYEFHFIQELLPECDAEGNVVKYCPQNDYDNKKGIPLSYYGKGAFCRFSINAIDWPGVYLWVVDGQIIYIGETAGLQQRFNMGYGNIFPRNCYIGGQSTNCKMNKVVLGNYERGKTVSLYFYITKEYKQVELELLRKIYTPYNDKDNKY